MLQRLLIIASVFALATAVSGCATSSSDSINVAKASSPKTGVTRLVPLRVGSAVPPPSWLQAPCPKNRCKQENPTDAELIGFNSQVAVFRNHAGYHFGYVRGKGLVPGVVVPGKLKLLQVLKGGRLVASDEDGKLLSVASIIEAVSLSAWKRVPGTPLVRTFSAAGSWIAYTDITARRVYTGKWLADAPAPTVFTATTPAKNATVWALAVRVDGMLAVRTLVEKKGSRMRGTMLRSSASKRWVKSTFHSVGGLAGGPSIWNGTPSCAAVLAADGKRWLEFEETFSGPWLLIAKHHWSKLIISGTHFHRAHVAGGKTSDFEMPVLRADKFLSNVKTGQSRCGTKLFGSAMGMMGSGRTGCVAARCLGDSVGASSALTPLHVGFLGDAECKGPAISRDTSVCRPKVPLSKMPTVVIGDRVSGSLSAHGLPRGCRPYRLEAFSGLGVLLCETGSETDSKLTVHTFSHKAPGTWRFEGRTIPRHYYGVRRGPDGTLLWQSRCPDDRVRGLVGNLGGGLGGVSKTKKQTTPKVAPKPVTPAPPCDAWVRRPVAAGTPDAWRRIHVDGAIAYRVGLGGHAVGLKVEKSSPRLVEAVVFRPDGTWRTMATFKTGKAVKSLEVDQEGRLVLTDRADDSKNERRRFVMTGGSLSRPLPAKE